MKIFGIGTDIVKVERIKKFIKKNSSLKRLFNKNEIIKCKKIKIITKEKLIHIDGEPLQLNQPIVINTSPKTLKILTPNE